MSGKIAWLLGKGSLKDFENVRDVEITDFRVSMIDKCQEAIEKRNQFDWEAMVFYYYPPDVESSSEISPLMSERLSPQVHVCL